MAGKRHAIINKETGKVVNVTIHEGAAWLPPEGHIIVQADFCDIDDSFDFKTNTIVRRDRTQHDNGISN